MSSYQYELLISLVQSYPHLYDKASKHFKDQQMRENSWQQIAEQVQLTVNDCQRMWTNLRNKYGREKKALPSGSAATSTPTWEYLEAMSFLDPYIKPRKTHTTSAIENAEKLQLTATTSLESPVFSEHSSSWPSSSTLIMSPSEPQLISPNCDLEENIIIEYEEEQPARNVKGKDDKRKKTGISANHGNSEVIDAAKSITEHLTRLSQKKQQSPSDALANYIASVLREMTPEQQKIKRRKLLQVLEEDDDIV